MDTEHQYHAKVHIIFMSSSAFNFALLEPTDLPSSDVAIDVWVIRNQDVILTQHYQHDAGLNWQFPKFIADLKKRFKQTISVQKQDFNQVLVLRNKQFSFVNFDSNDMYLCNNTTHLAHLATLFSQIIEQETSFLVELNSFQSMLQQAEIITTTQKPIVNETQTLAKRSVIRTDSSFSNKKSVFFADMPSKNPVSATNQNSDFHKVLSKMKRSLGDIFTPYSVTSIGDRANLNYKKMNKNFNSIHITESCETPWEVSNAAFNRRMWDCKVPGACKTVIIVQWRY